MCDNQQTKEREDDMQFYELPENKEKADDLALRLAEDGYDEAGIRMYFSSLGCDFFFANKLAKNAIALRKFYRESSATAANR